MRERSRRRYGQVFPQLKRINQDLQNESTTVKIIAEISYYVFVHINY
jgi:hypothetical protein